ncbi:hypothetical protein N7495_004219 [Penicillium taxi]|uniref:uncharacterized protein n=1 Tax=Penicillium taxi TaxID=168475 RepID=UPI002545A37A|nr:uncharacterized protein N7495_004219 [Penicillium taxi]KAJ5899475.1 hypothetical protein N7495_004219 [Penicillium taxi]
MAENKRQNPAEKGLQGSSGSAIGTGMATNTVSMDGTLIGSIGARLRITTAAPNSSTYEGTLFAADPITNLVAINTNPAAALKAKNDMTGDFKLFPISQIQSFHLLSLQPTDAQSSLPALDMRALKAREAKAVNELQEQEARRGKGVTREAQDIFDALGRTMPARWDGQNIIVADAVSIAPYYRVDDCRPLIKGDTAALARVRKVLEMERKKIELRTASATIGSTSTFSRTLSDQRKGG